MHIFHNSKSFFDKVILDIYFCPFSNSEITFGLFNLHALQKSEVRALCSKFHFYDFYFVTELFLQKKIFIKKHLRKNYISIIQVTHGDRKMRKMRNRIAM